MFLTTYHDVLNEKKFRKDLIADIISRFGDSIDAIAYSWIMYEVSGNASMIAFILALNYAPTIIVQPFVAVLVERMNKKRVMILCDILRGVIVISTMLLYVTGWISIWYLMVATLLTSTLESFRVPAGISFLSKIIPMDKMVSAKALSNSASTIAQIIGTSISGGLIAFFGTYFALLVDAFTFFASAIIILLIQYHENIEKDKLTLNKYKDDFKVGWHYLISKKILIVIILIGMVLNAMLIPYSSFQSIFIADYLHLNAQALSALSVAMMIGMFVGSIITPSFIERFGVQKCIVIFGFLFSPFYFASFLVPYFNLMDAWIYIIEMSSMFVFGVALGIMNVCFSSAFIQNVDEEFRSRISGICNSILTLMCPLMSMFCSLLAIFIRVNVIFLIIGIANISFFAFVANIKVFKQL